MPVSRELRKKVVEAIVAGIRRNGERCFSISQDTASCFVPTDTGMLKRSGGTEALPKGIRIFYRAPYSRTVEMGIPYDIPITGTQIVHIRKHRRKDGTIVKAHDKKYKDKRLIRIRPKMSKFEFGKPVFVVIDKISKREGQHFLGRSLEKGMPYLPTDIAFTLKRIGEVRTSG